MDINEEKNTICDIIIRKLRRDGNGYYYTQFRNNFDGYPEGVGETLQTFVLNEVNEHKSISPIAIGHLIYEISIADFDYIGNDNIKLNRSISYLYVIDIDERKIYCYEVDLSSHHQMAEVTDEDIISKDFSDSTIIRKRLVYKADFGDDFSDIKMS